MTTATMERAPTVLLMPRKPAKPKYELEGWGKLIADAREQAGLNQAELARKIGRAPSVISRIESENLTPNIEICNLLVASLPLTMDELLRAFGYHIPPLAEEVVELRKEMTGEQWEGLKQWFRLGRRPKLD